mgnify:CR=1 FL=1|tara:strand:+ start:1761 stop:2078 length:318 start_codon:yes stop_codon:yes gene_type:complete
MVAKKINYEDARLPSPSEGMLHSAGRAGFVCMMTNMVLFFDVEYTEWDELKPAYQDIWFQIARSMYAVIAIEGGATVEDISDVEQQEEEGPKKKKRRRKKRDEDK